MFGPKAWIWATLAVPSLAAQASFNLGNGFNLNVDKDSNQLSIEHGDASIWETVPGKPFLSASSGVDEVAGSSGNFKITDVDNDKCTDQHIRRVTKSAWDSSVNDHAAVIEGTLSGCGDESIDFSFAVWVPAELSDRVAFHIDVKPGSSKDAATKLFLTYSSSKSEDFYGMGGQGSFASLKNQSVPIFSREQGVGRGDQPTTDLESEDSFFAGGDQFTTYSAVPQYISSLARVFHLSEESTAYTKFNFEKADEVTVRYAALNVDGYIIQAKNMLDGITKLTDYTGRMAELPRWVDTGKLACFFSWMAIILTIFQALFSVSRVARPR